ncbi:MAG: galactokinase, partial [Catalinimonas sp.]
DLHAIEKHPKSWVNYLLGVVDELQKLGREVPGFDLVFGGNVPTGAGLSSSAAVECGLAFALNEQFDLGLGRLEIVKLGQRSENNFVGMNCGIMDQFAVVFGQQRRVIKLDCRSLEYEYYPFELDGYRVVLCDSRIKHALVDSEYNVRRAQCEAGVAVIQQRAPEVRSLRDVTVEMLERYRDELDPVVYRRCGYVVGENDRLELACRKLVAGDLKAFGEQMYLTHRGLSEAYEVSTPEMDFLVEYAEQDPHVLGARMMGGGFGGCTINLVEADGVDVFAEGIGRAYRQHTGREPVFYVTRIEAGTSLL